MDLVKLLSKLHAIGGMQGAMTEEKKPDADKDGVPDWADKKHGEDDTEDKKEKANEDIFNVLKGLQAIRESKCPDCGHDPCDCEDHDHDEKIDECGMDMSPLTSMADANGMPAGAINVQQPTSPEVNMATDYDDATDAYPGQENAPAEEKPQFTLTIRNGESNLSMTTDTPDEIIHVMKLAGIPGKAEVKKAEPAADQGKEKEVEEAWGNTPAATNEKEPTAYGDIRDWGRKGQGAGKPNYPGTKASGDNPMSEGVMFEEYKRFKAGK